jgi:broad specificity phosphatase PhoE
MFFVLRHGQTDWNVALRLQGSTDIPLNETGRAQARKAADIFAEQTITRIIASPLSRALETAQIVGAKLGLEPTTDMRLIERHFGLFEGLTVDEVKAHRREMGAHMRLDADLDGKHYPHNAETLGAVIDRVKACVEEHISSDDACLFVCHGIPFRAITRIFLGEMHSSPNACPVRFERETDQWAMIALDPENLPIHASAFDGPTTMGRL